MSLIHRVYMVSVRLMMKKSSTRYNPIADVILNVINALNLDRDLFLTLQLIDMGKKVSLLLNFSDELKKRKIKIDTKKLSDLLGVEVYGTTAVDKLGFDQLGEAVNSAKVGKQELDLHFLLNR